MRAAWIEVNLKHIKDNIRSIKSLLKPTTKFMAVIKANAYGHGLLPVAQAAQEAGADRLGVALITEAVALRKAGFTLPIHILSETALDDAPLIWKYRLIPTVYSEKMLSALAAAVPNNWLLPIHLKVDTGMHRVGADLEKIQSLYRLAEKSQNLFVEGVFTHFACADEAENSFTKQQLKLFLSLKEQINARLWHCANSAATFYFPESHLDMVRVGISLYGLLPGKQKLPVELKPALSLRAKIAHLRQIKKGEGVSYGLTFKASEPKKIAVIPLGYGDGYSRRLSNLASVIVRGKRQPVVGNVCMDQLLVALSQHELVEVGDEVILIGRQRDTEITAEELAEKSGTINYEIVCALNERLPRIYK